MFLYVSGIWVYKPLGEKKKHQKHLPSTWDLPALAHGSVVVETPCCAALAPQPMEVLRLQANLPNPMDLFEPSGYLRRDVKWILVEMFRFC